MAPGNLPGSTLDGAPRRGCAVLYCPKSALAGNRLRAVIRKKMNRKPMESIVEFVLPDHVVDTLNALPLRPEEHPDYWFWSRDCSPVVNTNKWVRKKIGSTII
jgi:hypothetical protein